MRITGRYEWKRETGDIESYKHDQTGGWLHIDSQGTFYDREAEPTSREAALEYANHGQTHSVDDNSKGKSPENKDHEQSFSL
jgi:hypothetical protein